MHRNRRPAYDALRRVDLFAPCTDSELEHVLALTTPLHVCAGAILATEGAPVREFLIIVNGCADVAVQDEALVTLGRDDLIGETALGHSNPHRATITARTDLELLVSSPRELRRLLDTVPAITRRLLVRYASRPSAHVEPTTDSHAFTLLHRQRLSPRVHEIEDGAHIPRTRTDPPVAPAGSA
jgi:CRP-like cAMP-binding protein